MPRLILLKSAGRHPQVKEAPAAAAITPGDLVEVSGGEVQRHSTAGGNSARAFAKEHVHRDIDTDYAAGETTPYMFAQSGDEVYALLASGENVAAGAVLESAGNGQLQAHTAVSTDVPTEAVVGRAVEAVDASGGVERIIVEVA